MGEDESYLGGVSGVWWELALEPDPDGEGMGGPEFAGCHPWCIRSVLFHPPLTTGLPYLAGITPWNDPTSSDIKAAVTTLGQQLIPGLTSFALDPHTTFTTYVWQHVHFRIWRAGDQTLVVGVNLNPQVWQIPLTQLPGWKAYTRLEVVYNGGASFESGNLALWDLGSVGFVVMM